MVATTPCLCGNEFVGDSLVRGRSRIGENVDIRACSECGVLRTYPPPSIEELNRTIYASDEGYRDQVRFDQGFRCRMFLDFVSGFLRNAQPKMLDVACGAGQLLVEARRRGWNARGIDINERAVEFAREQRKVDVVSGTVDSLPMDELYDVITLRHALEHIDNPVGMLRMLTARLKDDGVICIEVPNRDGLYARILGPQWYGYGVSQHLWHFTPTSIKKVAERAGLKVNAISCRFCLDYPVPTFLRPMTELPGTICNLGDDMMAAFSKVR